MTRNGTAYLLRPLVRLTEEIDSGLWATPASRDWKDTPGMAREALNRDGSTRNRTDQLARQVYAEKFPTPTADKGLMVPLSPERAERFRRKGHSGSFVEAMSAVMWPTPKSTFSGPDYARVNRAESGGDDLATAVAREQAGSLNPAWVEWLMGYPLGWTDLCRSEMPLSRKSPKSSDDA
jgi:hypothetical protein